MVILCVLSTVGPEILGSLEDLVNISIIKKLFTNLEAYIYIYFFKFWVTGPGVKVLEFIALPIRPEPRTRL